MADETQTNTDKAGARNSGADLARLQMIHDYAVENGAACSEKGNALKAISETDDELRVGNYIVLFGGRDLEGIASPRVNGDGSRGEYFTPDTSLESEATKAGRLDVDWEHRSDPERAGVGDAILGYVDWATAKADKLGVWVERVLDRRNRYMQFLEQLIKAGLVGNSSEADPQGVEKAADGAITRWPLVRDTLTVTPMEPRMLTMNTVQALKALGVQLPTSSERDAEAAGDATPSAGEPAIKSVTEEGVSMTPEEIQAMIDAAVDKATKAVVASLPATNGGGYIEVVKDEADQPFESFGAQLKAVAAFTRSNGAQADPRLRGKQLGLNEGMPSEGGFLVQQDFAPELLRRSYDLGVLASRIRRVPVSANANGLKVNAVAETSRVRGSRWGGVRAYWLGEAGTKLPTDPVFRSMQLDLKKLIGLCYATDELMQDTSALESIISQAFSEEFAYELDDAIFRGAGAGVPLGILSSPALVTQAAEAGQLADTIVHENIVKMWSRMWGRSRANAIWVYNQDCEPQLYTMGLAVGTGGVPSFMPPGGLSGAPYATLMGRPAIPLEQASTLGDVGDIALIDPTQYLGIDKGGVQTASSIHVQFLTDQTAFRFVYRFDGQPTWVAPLTPATGSANTLSPFVVLAAR